jgi:cytochrome c-type biogenesis protein CcmH
MILPLSLALLTAFALLALLMPLLRRRYRVEARAAHDLAIYKDQLAELKREAASGAIGAEAEKAARIEIERRILAAGAEGTDARIAEIKQRRWLPAIIGVGLPLLALGLYVEIGNPQLPAQPLASRAKPTPVMTGDTEARVRAALDQLRQRLQTDPKDVSAWLALGRLRLGIGQSGEAVAALREAERLAPDNVEVLVTLAEALTFEAQGSVTPTARALFERALTRDPKLAGARYYIGLAELQAGDARAALARWLDLEADSPADAPWLATLAAEIDRVSKQAGIDLKTIRPDRKTPKAADPAMPQPGADDIARMEKLSPQEREAAIKSMVDRLADRLKDSPDDLDGWRRLGRARGVLNDHAGAAEAWKQADRLKPDDQEILAAWAEALLRGAGPTTELAEPTLVVLRRLEKVNPHSGLALFYLAEAAEQAGDREGAVTRLRKLRDMMPANAPARAAVDRRIQALEEKK